MRFRDEQDPSHSSLDALSSPEALQYATKVGARLRSASPEHLMVNHIRHQIDLLSQLTLPDRFEALNDHLGVRLAEVLVGPDATLTASLHRVADHIRSSRQGALLPLFGESGAGKTTLAQSINQWLGQDFGPTITYDGPLTFDGLSDAVKRLRETLPVNFDLIVPVNIDHRESAPPNETELAQVKRFLRTSPHSVRCLALWPETDRAIARQVGQRYKKIAGAQPFELLEVNGPDRKSWQDIASTTLRLANGLDNLEGIGVDPASYSPEEYPSLGEFLRTLQMDFNSVLSDLRSKLTKAVVVAIVFVSEGNDPGVLNFITSSSRHGILDAQGLLSSTPESTIGKWWTNRQGLLVRAIVQLNAHALFLPPSISMSALRNFAPTPDRFFDTLDIARLGPARAISDLDRSDLSKVIQGKPLGRYESRGNPAHNAISAFQLLAEEGFNLGKDKNLNKIMADGWRKLLTSKEIEFDSVSSEQSLEFCNLIPDNSIIYNDTAICVEYTWRKGDFLKSSNRSTVAQYILQKLKGYVLELGWTSP